MHNFPAIPTQDLLLAMLSGSLFVGALVYYIHAQTEEWIGGFPHREPRAFLVRLTQRDPDDGYRRYLSFTASSGLHVVLLSGILLADVLFIPTLVPVFQPNELMVLEYRVPEISLVAPEQFEEAFQEAPDPQTAPPAPGRQSASSNASPAAPAPQPRLQAPPRRTAAPERFRPVFKVVLPSIVAENPALRDILIQPNIDLELASEISRQLPPILQWMPNPNPLENAMLIEPGRSRPSRSSSPEFPDLEPLRRPTDNQSLLAELVFSEVRVVFETPSLPVETSDATPLRGTDASSDAADLPSLGQGESSTSLVALSSEPDPLSPSFLLELGLRLGSIEQDQPEEVGEGTFDPTAETLAAESAGESIETAAAEETAIEPVAGEAVNQEADSAEAGGDGAAGESAAEGVEVASEGSGAEDSLGESASASGESTSGTDEAAAESGEGAAGGGSGSGRFKPRPRKEYGIILVANAANTLPEGIGVLSGNPIYTVYMDVPSSPRKWIFQFCVPGSPSNRIQIIGGVVKIPRRKKIDPPFALRKEPLGLDPAEAPAHINRAVVYAKVDAEGVLGSMRMIRGTGTESDKQILAKLSSWKFLPAFADGNPVEVEALFGIPLR